MLDVQYKYCTMPWDFRLIRAPIHHTSGEWGAVGRDERMNERARGEGRTISVRLAVRLSGCSTFNIRTTKDAAQLNGPSYGICGTVLAREKAIHSNIAHSTLKDTQYLSHSFIQG